MSDVFSNIAGFILNLIFSHPLMFVLFMCFSAVVLPELNRRQLVKDIAAEVIKQQERGK